jgi:amidase
MEPTDLAFAGLARQAELIREGELSSRELVEVYLELIERIDPELNAFRTVYAERALAEAEQAEARRAAGEQRPLLGVPVAVKDNVDVAGDVTTHGTEAYGAPAAEDAEVVKRLRSAGAVPIGKTRLSELAMWPFTLSSAWGASRNPWDTERTPGGSSGGSAAAVSAGLAPAATASDGGGSIRVPAACCGLFGLKPQRGRVSMMPDPEHWHGLSAWGTVTRSVADTGLYLDVVAGPAPGDADTPPPPPRPFSESARFGPGKLRIALSLKPATLAPAAREVCDAARSTAELLRSLGHEVRERDPDYGELLHLFLPLWLRGIHDDAAGMPRPQRLERRSRAVARIGAAIPPSWVSRARAAQPAAAARINEIFDDHDVLLTPNPGSLPLPLDRVQHRSTARTWAEAAGFVCFSTPWNLTGQPAAAVPAGFTDGGLPLSAQLVGRPNDEGTLLSLAAQIEAERPWAERRPPIG